MPAVSSYLSKLQSASHKVRWGTRSVGVTATVRGVVRMTVVRVRRPETVEIKLRSGGRLAFRNPSQLVPALVLFGDLIDPEYPFLRHIVTPEWTVIDAGAAVGQFTVFAALLGCSTVHAYEPSSANIESLNGNLKLNDIGDRVSVHQAALSETEGEAQFATQATTYLSRLDSDMSGAETETVRVLTLDRELQREGLNHLNLLKINVAGFEPEVLGGTESALAAGSIDVLVMLVSMRSIPWLEKLQKYGYRVGFYHPGERRFYELTTIDEESVTHPPSPARHIIAVHSGAVERGILRDIEIVTGR